MEQEDNKELMAQLEGIINDAAYGVKSERKKEMQKVLSAIAKSAESNFSFAEEPYALILIQQVDLEDVDHQRAHRTEDAEGMDLAQLRAAGYGAGVVTTPFHTKTLNDMREILDSPSNQLLTDIMMGKRDWASVTRHKQNGATVYMLVAAGCITTLTLTPSGEEVLSHHETSGGDASEYAKAFAGETGHLMQSQWGFTATVQRLRNTYPKAYVELTKDLEERLKDEGDTE